MLWGADGREMNLEVLRSERETDVCFCLSGKLELVISTILKQNRRPGVLLYNSRVSQQAQCKSAQLEHLPPVCTVQKCIYAKTAYVVNNRLLSIIFSDPFWAIVLSLSSDVWSKWRLSLQVIMELGRYLNVLALNDSFGCKEGVKG